MSRKRDRTQFPFEIHHSAAMHEIISRGQEWMPDFSRRLPAVVIDGGLAYVGGSGGTMEV